MSAPYRITTVCLGNICRSPMAAAVLQARLERAALGREVVVDSAGTGGWHVGEGADPRAIAVLERHGYPLDHVARRFDPAWFEESDLILAMDSDNMRDLLRMAPDAAARGRVRMMRSFDTAAKGRRDGDDLDVPDPYYGGDTGFEKVLAMLETSSDGVVEYVRAALAERP